MNKSELIEALATKAELSKAAAGRAVDVLVEEIVTAVAKGDSVALVSAATNHVHVHRRREQAWLGRGAALGCDGL